MWNGAARTTAFISATKLTAAILATDVATAGSYPVRVQSGGGLSNPETFTVTAAVTGPVLTSLSPSTAAAGGAAFALTVNGTGFATGAVVKWNGQARTTAFVSATKLTAAILASDSATAWTCPITVVSGGSTSNSLNFTATPPSSTPTLTSISPQYVLVGSPALTLTVNGTNFVTGEVVYWNTTKLTTTFVSATKLTASVPASDLTTLGTANITAANSGAAASNSLPFTVAPSTHTPLAYGFFTQTGTPGATSGNITCAWNTSEYLCTLTGESFFYSKYVVNVTPADTNTPAVPTVNSVGGNIIVKIYNLSGTPIQTPFYITIFKP
jgi:hypothetical protein